LRQQLAVYKRRVGRPGCAGGGARRGAGPAWFSVAHANTGTAALDGVGVVAAIKQLLAQTPLGSTARIGVPFMPGRLYLVCASSEWDKACDVNQT
jgi:hypothetical protein